MTDESPPSDGVIDDERPAGEAGTTGIGAAGTRAGTGAEASQPVAGEGQQKQSTSKNVARFARELALIIGIALIASALLRAFVVQAYYVPSGSMLPAIHVNDRILVSRIGDIDRGEVVVFEDPGSWIPASEQPAPPGNVRQALEWIGVLPASGHEHLVKRVIGLPGDHVVCCSDGGQLIINGQPVDESDFLDQGDRKADETPYDVVVPEGHIFVLGDHRYVSGDSSKQRGQDKFVSMDLVVGRAFAVIWPAGNMHLLKIPDAYDDVPDGQTPPALGIINSTGSVTPHDR
jgi:signal peptidase I